jgi:hypothetical protein
MLIVLKLVNTFTACHTPKHTSLYCHMWQHEILGKQTLTCFPLVFPHVPVA